MEQNKDVMKNSVIVEGSSNSYQDKVEIAKSLFGIIKSDMTLEEVKEERLSKI